jgi:hypothetical protein
MQQVIDPQAILEVINKVPNTHPSYLLRANK